MPRKPKYDVAIGLARMRRAAGLTAKEFADEIGVSFATVYGWESGRPPTYVHLRRMASCLGVTVEDLIDALGETRARESVRVAESEESAQSHSPAALDDSH